jgi:hypothetical protein
MTLPRIERLDNTSSGLEREEVSDDFRPSGDVKQGGQGDKEQLIGFEVPKKITKSQLAFIRRKKIKIVSIFRER